MPCQRNETALSRSHGYSPPSSLNLTDATGLCENQGGVFFRPLASFPLRDPLYHTLFCRSPFSHSVYSS